MASGTSPSWPGLDGSNKEVKVDPDKMEAIADKLQELLDGYRSGPGSPSNLQQGGRVTAADAGNWSVGQALVSSSDQIYSALGSYYNDLAVQLQNAIAAIRATAANYKGADQATGDAARNVNNSGPAPTSSGTEQW